jgi:hypothetical protein
MPTAAAQEYGTIVICGGGCYGGYYLRQLARARAAGALRVQRILVVDQQPACRVAPLVDAIARDDAEGIAQGGWNQSGPDRIAAAPSTVDDGYRNLPVSLVIEPWTEFFARWFADAIASPSTAAHDAVVPSPLMPNLLADWIASRLAVHRPKSDTRRVTLAAAPDTPWARTGADLSHYASFATWMCPINCIEPPRCPETRGPRDWSMPVAVQAAANSAHASASAYDVVAMFRTTHRAYGVGMFDVQDALDAEAAIASRASQPSVRVLLASVSHCHGALAELVSTRG